MKPDSSFRRWLAAAGVVAVCLGAPAPASAQSLEEAMIRAYVQNPTLLAARAALRSVDERAAQALSAWRPTVTATGSLAYERADTNLGPFDGSNPNSFGLDLTQPLYRAGRTDALSSQADNVIAAQRASLTATEQQVLLDTVTSYMNVVLARQVVDLAISNERRLLRQLEATEDRFRVGEVTRTDVSQARARQANAVADRIQAEGDLISRAARFEEVIGIEPIGLSRPGPLIGLPGTPGEALAIAGEGNPAIAGAVAAERAARDGIDVEFAGLLPDVDLVASLARNEDLSPAIKRRDEFSIQARLTIPLYQAGLESSQVREARQTAARRSMEVDEARRRVEADVVTAWQAFATALAAVDAFTEEVEANRVALEGAQREAQVGERTVLDVLDAEQELFRSRISLATAERDAVVASYALQAALGRLTAGYLRLPVELYDVETYYDRAREAWWGSGDLAND